MGLNSKTFTSFNFGCRVNSAETNQWSQLLIDRGYTPNSKNPDIILVNTCAITKKGEYESIYQIKKLSSGYPQSTIIVTGCADLSKVAHLPNIRIYSNSEKESLLKPLNSGYTPNIKDKFSHTHRFLLKVQSGCTANCSYCTVPLKRFNLWSLPITTAIATVNKAISDGYQEVIITGINLNQYQPGFSNLVEALLTQTSVPLISFGSIPLLCVDDKFISLLSTFGPRISPFLHIPIQSGSNKILRIMGRPYDKKRITETFSKLKGFSFGTDIIVGFPGETESDFQESIDLCRQIGFTKIHTFKFSPRPNTPARLLYQQSSPISKNELIRRSRKIRSLISQTKPPSRQTPDI